MRRAEPLEPEVAAALAAIDATLAGESVDPGHAELAELALILRAERPVAPVEVAGALDRRIAERLSPPRPAPSPVRPRRWHRWLAAPAATAAAIALVVVVVNLGGQGSSSSSSSSFSSSSAASAASAAGAGSAPGPLGQESGSATVPERTPAPAAKSAAPTGTPPAPSTPRSRQVVQSGQLTLSAAPGRIDAVAQQVFDVVDAEHGFVTSSHVTATGRPGAAAHFRLSVPEGNLQRTMSRLSRLRGADVVSRTDDTTDITGQVGGAGRQLAQLRAVRRSLLHQLAAATTSGEIAGLKTKLSAVNAAIGRQEATLSGLHRRVDYSTVTVTVRATRTTVAPPSHGGGFTLHRALHDAGHVLVVVAGVTLIALAVLFPIGLVAALILWATYLLRRHRRETALDLM